MFKFTAVAAIACTISLITPASKAEAGNDPFIGELMLVGFNFCPRNWADANGALLAISSHQALFSLLGTMYGGDGRTTFGLPDLRGRVAVGTGTGPGLSPVAQGNRFGVPTTTQTIATMANHSHTATSTGTTTIHTAGEDATQTEPSGAVFGYSGTAIYSTFPPDETMASSAATTNVATTIVNSGGGQAQENHQPSLGLRYCIALNGTYPSRN